MQLARLAVVAHMSHGWQFQTFQVHCPHVLQPFTHHSHCYMHDNITSIALLGAVFARTSACIVARQ